MIGIVDYKMGNIQSIRNALEKIGLESFVSDNPDKLVSAEALMLPGVGAAGDAMRNLKQKTLDSFIINIAKEKPVLGICLGMQILFDKSEEGETDCLGIIKGRVKKFSRTVKIPQIGWNEVAFSKNKLFEGMNSSQEFYFVNSFYCEPDDKDLIAGESEYGIKFCSVVQMGNVTGFQFHPEKSGEWGLKLLDNYFKLVL
jgi:glutamine amidotransferase